MLIEADNNGCFNYYSAPMSIASLYIVAGDTVTDSLRWFLLIMSNNPEYQQKAFEELQSVISEHGILVREHCHYMNSVLLESMRLRPVSDSLPHMTTEDTEIDGHLIKAGTPVIASYTTVMHDPKNFIEPQLFKPERFLVDKKYQEEF